jgi:hypothetical protein
VQYSFSLPDEMTGASTEADATVVRLFKGILYAAPPVGELRFKAPHPPHGARALGAPGGPLGGVPDLGPRWAPAPSARTV